MVIWVCEASEVNNLTVLAVGPNGHNKDKDKDDKDKIASSGSDPPMGSDKKLSTNPLKKSKKVQMPQQHTFNPIFKPIQVYSIIWLFSFSKVRYILIQRLPMLRNMIFIFG